MSTTVLGLIIAAIIFVIAFVVFMRRQIKLSKEAQAKVDPGKIKTWKDDD